MPRMSIPTIFPNLLQRVQKLLRKKQLPELRALLADQHVPDIAHVLDALDTSSRLLVFRLLPRELASEVFAYAETAQQNTIIDALTDDEARKLLAALQPDERTELFDELPEEVTQRLFLLLSPEDMRETNDLLGYPPESIGRLITPNFVSVQQDWTVAETIAHIRELGKTSETVNVVYVQDSASKLIGLVSLRTLLFAKPEQTIGEVMKKNVVRLNAYDDQEHSVSVMQEHDLAVLPVVDNENTLLGIVTFDDVMDIAEEETTEDFHAFSGMLPLHESYAYAGVLNLYRRRIGWLIGLVAVSLLSSGVIAAFEETLAKTITLAFFIPLLIGSGGNAGSQSAMLMIRALSTGDVTLGNWLKIVSKESFVALLLGLTLALASAALGMWRGGAAIGIVVGLSMATIVFVANMIGGLLPFMLVRMRMDPAVASGPLVTSIADVAGLFLYFTIASFILL